MTLPPEYKPYSGIPNTVGVGGTNPKQSNTTPMPDWTQQDARQTPVDSDKCLFCKIPRDDWDTDVSPVLVGGGEVLCSNCLGDLRQYQRYQYIMTFVSGGFAPGAKHIIHQHFEEARDEVVNQYPDDAGMFPIPTQKSDAEGQESLEDTTESITRDEYDDSA